MRGSLFSLGCIKKTKQKKHLLDSKDCSYGYNHYYIYMRSRLFFSYDDSIKLRSTLKQLWRPCYLRPCGGLKVRLPPSLSDSKKENKCFYRSSSAAGLVSLKPHPSLLNQYICSRLPARLTSQNLTLSLGMKYLLLCTCGLIDLLLHSDAVRY